MKKLLLLFIPLLLGMSNPPEQCFPWVPPTIRTDGSPLKLSEIKGYRVEINGKVQEKLYPGIAYNQACVWLKGRVCAQVMAIDLQGRQSKWHNLGCKG